MLTPTGAALRASGGGEVGESFSYAYWPSVCSFWNSVYPGPLSILKNWIVSVFGVELYKCGYFRDGPLFWLAGFTG